MSQKLKSITIDGQKFEIDAAATPDYNPIYIGTLPTKFSLEGIPVPTGVETSYEIKFNESFINYNDYGFQLIFIPKTRIADDGSIFVAFETQTTTSEGNGIWASVANFGLEIRKTTEGSTYGVIATGANTFYELFWETNPSIATGQVLSLSSAYEFDVYIVYPKQ
jgi:hypothetical protein